MVNTGPLEPPRSRSANFLRPHGDIIIPLKMSRRTCGKLLRIVLLCSYNTRDVDEQACIAFAFVRFRYGIWRLEDWLDDIVQHQRRRLEAYDKGRR